MAKFINKKEKVYDFKLTPYGHYLLSIGYFKPKFYGFFDDNIIYDYKYAGVTGENQNNINNRIKKETQYIESTVIFSDIEAKGVNSVTDDAGTYFKGDVTSVMEIPREDLYRVEGMIGDAWFEGTTQTAPAWKVVALDGLIKSSSIKDTVNNINIPQVNIELNYQKIIEAYTLETDLLNTSYMEPIFTSDIFSDGNVVKLVSDDLLMYTEEVNTALLTENFDIEVFEVNPSGIISNPSTATNMDSLRRLYFEKDFERIEGGMLDPEKYGRNYMLNYTSQSVDYYMDFTADYEIPSAIACRGAELFNKESYYVDLDFECNTQKEEAVYNDIYGPVTEPEICL